jgi:hypothetical protein
MNCSFASIEHLSCNITPVLQKHTFRLVMGVLLGASMTKEISCSNIAHVLVIFHKGGTEVVQRDLRMYNTFAVIACHVYGRWACIDGD